MGGGGRPNLDLDFLSHILTIQNNKTNIGETRQLLLTDSFLIEYY